MLTQMRDTMGGPYRSMLMLLLAAGGTVLLIACANAAHLFVAQMRKRTLGGRGGQRARIR